jgi:hypothetical protein
VRSLLRQNSLVLGKKEEKNGNGANLGFEEKMWKAADKLRNNRVRVLFQVEKELA